MFVCTGAEIAPRTTSKLILRQLRMLTAITFVACLTACINPKHLGNESSGTVSGRILDATNNAPIAVATISDEDDRQSTASPDGAFSFRLPSGTHQLLIHADGYLSKRATVTIPAQASVLINTDGYERLQPVKNP